MLTQTNTSATQPSPAPSLANIPMSHLEHLMAPISTTLPAYGHIHSDSFPLTDHERHAALLHTLLFETGAQTVNPAALPELPEDLQDAMADLHTAADEATEEGYPLPEEIALSNAERILQRLYALWPIRFEVYPTPDGEIAVVAPGGFGRSATVLCDSQGGALCMANLNGKHRRARYSSAEGLPDGFLRKAMDELKHGER